MKLMRSRTQSSKHCTHFVVKTLQGSDPCHEPRAKRSTVLRSVQEEPQDRTPRSNKPVLQQLIDKRAYLVVGMYSTQLRLLALLALAALIGEISTLKIYASSCTRWPNLG